MKLIPKPMLLLCTLGILAPSEPAQAQALVDTFCIVKPDSLVQLPCRSRVPGAPHPVPTNAIEFDAAQEYYEKYCPEHTCMIDLSGAELANFDYLGLLTELRTRLRRAGNAIAFSGVASGEVMITTKKKQRESFSPFFYQVRLVASECVNSSNLRSPCYVHFRAVRVELETDDDGVPKKLPTSDALCDELDSLVLLKIREAATRAEEASYRKTRRSGG